MSEKPARQPMTDGEREILFQVQQLQAKWFDTIEMCFHREFNHLQRIEELRQEVQHSAAQGQRAILSQMVEFRDECLTALAQCHAELLRQVRQIMGLTKAVTTLTQEVQELREQITKDRLF
jgi:hypothetical protein